MEYVRSEKKSRSRAERSLDVNIGKVIPKDYPWKVLSALNTDLAEFINVEDNELLSQIIRDRDLDALFILMDEWSLQNLCKRPGMRVDTLRAYYQLSALLKKFCFKTEKATRLKTAKDKFFAAEIACGQFNAEGYKKFAFPETVKEVNCVTYAKSFLLKLLGPRPESSVVEWTRHGPGANLDTICGQTSLFNKNDNWPYSCTRPALGFARFLISSDKRWLGALEDSYRSRFNIPRHAILNQQVFWDNVLKVVEGNRITTVPKDARTERTIAIEPCINLMGQLGVDGFIRKRLKRYGIDLDSQVKNQRMAMRGSINGGTDFCTLDLSAASDSISLKLCEILLPSEWYSYLVKLRSPSGEFGEETISYEKISSMGNGYTFVLESAIFASLVIGVLRSYFNIDRHYQQHFTVYGDDIIVPGWAAEKVVKMLNLAGFKLNLDKSFLSGPIRESCGADWFLGKPIRPVFLKNAPTNVMELFNDINRLTRILQLRWGIQKSKTSKTVAKWIPEKFWSITGPPSDEEFDTYWHATFRTARGYQNGQWVYSRLIRKPISVNCDSFFFRKIMHSLRGVAQVTQKWDQRLVAAGSQFTVCKSKSYTVGLTYPTSGNWCEGYAERVG